MRQGTRQGRAGSLRAWVAGRWRGEAPLGTVFWDDMLIAGSALNLGLTRLAMALASADAPDAVAALAFFAPLPANLFLVAAVWRSAARSRPLVAAAARGAALFWLVVATTL